MNLPSKKIGIHQPNLFPWLGFFNKIYKSDIFVYLNHVENNPRTAIYTKRVKISVNKQEYWLTCSLKNEPNTVFVPINKMKLDNPERLKDKHLKTLELNYKKYPFFKETFWILQEFYDHKSDLISERNITSIDTICRSLNIETNKVISDTLEIYTTSNQMLIDIVKKLDGNCYVPGGGASEYQQDELFTNNGIDIIPQDFKHTIYPQANNQQFIPGLSIIDAIMNVGFQHTEILVKNG